MNHKKLLFVALMLCIGLTVKAQDFISAKFTIEDYKNGVQEIQLTFNTFSIGITPDGQISFIQPLRRSRSNDWDDFDDNPVHGSRNLGNLNVTYFDNFDRDKAGKIKSIDGVAFNYYDSFDIHDKKGRLKSIGNINLKYNNGFDMHETQGTLKSVGPIKITWYNSFDDKSLRGKIKSIKGNTRNLYVTRVYNQH